MRQIENVLDRFGLDWCRNVETKQYHYLLKFIKEEKRRGFELPIEGKKKSDFLDGAMMELFYGGTGKSLYIKNLEKLTKKSAKKIDASIFPGRYQNTLRVKMNSGDDRPFLEISYVDLTVNMAILILSRGEVKKQCELFNDWITTEAKMKVLFEPVKEKEQLKNAIDKSMKSLAAKVQGGEILTCLYEELSESIYDVAVEIFEKDFVSN